MLFVHFNQKSAIYIYYPSREKVNGEQPEGGEGEHDAAVCSDSRLLQEELRLTQLGR